MSPRNSEYELRTRNRVLQMQFRSKEFLIQWFNDLSHYEKKKNERESQRNRDRHTGRTPREDWGRDKRGVSTSQEMLRTPATTRRWEKGMEQLLQSAQKEPTLLILWFWTSSLQICEGINGCCIKSLNLWYFVTAVPGN